MKLQEDDVSKLLSSAALIFVGQIIYSLSELFERIIIARILTPDSYGEVSIGLSILTFATTIGVLGVKEGVPRFMSRYDDTASKRGAWLSGMIIGGVTSSTLAVVLLATLDVFTTRLFETDAASGLMMLFVICIPLIVGLQLGIAGIRGQENTIYRTYANDLVYPITRVILLVVFLLAGFGIQAAGMAYVGATVVAVVVAYGLLNRLVPLIGSAPTQLREMLVFSVPLVFATVLSRLLTQTDTVMLGYFRSSFEVGLYSSAYPLASGLLLVLSSFGFLYLPLASRLDADDRRTEIDSIYTLTTKWVYILTFPLFLTLVVFPNDVLGIVFGEPYNEAGVALSILAIGFFTSASFGRNRETLSALGFTVSIMFANGVAFVGNVALNLLLIPRYGYLGASVASASSFVMLNLTVYLILKFKYGITPFSKWSNRTFVVLPITLFPIALAVANWLSLTVFTLPLFLCTAGLLTLVVVFATGCLQPEDRIPISIIEQKLERTIPFIHRYMPESKQFNRS